MSTTIFQKRHISRTSFNSKKELDTILDKNAFQGYRIFLLVYSLSHNNTLTLKDDRGFKAISVVRLDESLVYIDQLYHFMKIINLSRVLIPPPP